MVGVVGELAVLKQKIGGGHSDEAEADTHAFLSGVAEVRIGRVSPVVIKVNADDGYVVDPAVQDVIVVGLDSGPFTLAVIAYHDAFGCATTGEPAQGGKILIGPYIAPLQIDVIRIAIPQQAERPIQ